MRKWRVEKGKREDESGSFRCTGNSHPQSSLVTAKGISQRIHLKWNHDSKQLKKICLELFLMKVRIIKASVFYFISNKMYFTYFITQCNESSIDFFFLAVFERQHNTPIISHFSLGAHYYPLETI